MNHPKPDEWVPYFYGEAETETRRRLKQHLKACPECRSQIEVWRRSLQRLDSWRVPGTTPARRGYAPVLRWAAALVLVLAAGFGIGRSMASNASVERVRARLEPEMRQQLRSELVLMLKQELDRSSASTLAKAREEAQKIVADSVSDLEARRLEDNHAIYAALDKVFLSLKKDVDTVAVNADESLRRLSNPESEFPQP